MTMHHRIPLKDVNKFYQALYTFYELLHQPDNLIHYKLTEGVI